MEKNPFLRHPKNVCLIGLGSSASDYMINMVAADLQHQFDEVWTVNMGLRIFRHDVVWVMDDLRGQARTYPDYGRLLQEHDKPIITSQPYPEFPQSIRYPIEEVSQAIGDDYFTNTVCYAIAWAMTSGVKDLTLYGCDFFYPNIAVREEGGMNAAYFLGLSRHFGMTFHIPQQSTLLSSYAAKEVDGKLHRKLYGYAKQPLFATGGENVVGAEQNTQLREDQGNDSGSSQAGQPGNTNQKRARRTAAVHSGRQGVGRRRRGSNKSAGVVLGGSRQTKPDGEIRGRTDRGSISNFVRDGMDGTPPKHCERCGSETHREYLECLGNAEART